MSDIHWQDIEQMKANQDYAGLSGSVETLLKMPQSFCKQRGDCCRIATFKGTLSHEEIQNLAHSDDPDSVNARDFLTLFQPYDSHEEVRTLSPVFYQRVIEQTAAEAQSVTFFKCRFLMQDGRCGVHEDRPSGCRAYPFPHAKTVYHPGCGFEQQGRENWDKIQEILQYLKDTLAALNNEKAALTQDD